MSALFLELPRPAASSTTNRRSNRRAGSSKPSTNTSSRTSSHSGTLERGEETSCLNSTDRRLPSCCGSAYSRTGSSETDGAEDKRHGGCDGNGADGSGGDHCRCVGVVRNYMLSRTCLLVRIPKGGENWDANVLKAPLTLDAMSWA